MPSFPQAITSFATVLTEITDTDASRLKPVWNLPAAKKFTPLIEQGRFPSGAIAACILSETWEHDWAGENPDEAKLLAELSNRYSEIYPRTREALTTIADVNITEHTRHRIGQFLDKGQQFSHDEFDHLLGEVHLYCAHQMETFLGSQVTPEITAYLHPEANSTHPERQ